MWTKPEEDTLHLRQQVVLSCLHCSNIDETLLLQTLPRHFLALCCLVHYFVINGPDSMMRDCDVNAFIAQAVCLRLHTARTIWNLRVSSSFDCLESQSTLIFLFHNLPCVKKKNIQGKELCILGMRTPETPAESLESSGLYPSF